MRQLAEHAVLLVVVLAISWIPINIWVPKEWSRTRKFIFTAMATVVVLFLIETFHLSTGRDITDEVSISLICPILKLPYCPDSAPPPPPVPPVTTPGGAPPQDDSRPLTYYSAKEALSHLELYLKDNNAPNVDDVFRMLPASTATYQSDASLQRTIGGWIIDYRDTAGAVRIATLTCWGGVGIEAAPAAEHRDIQPIKVSDIVLDDTDASDVVLQNGGEGKSDGHGPVLLSAQVQGRGVRPVWAGGQWFIRANDQLVMVDARSGELYAPGPSDNELVPLTSAIAGASEWNGGFDANSADAIFDKSAHYYLWPRAYVTGTRRYIYNRSLISQLILRQGDRNDAGSLSTKGVLFGAMGDYARAIDYLTASIKAAPSNADYRYDRSVFLLMVRDFKRAQNDLLTLDTLDARRVDGMKLLNELENPTPKDTLMESEWNMMTADGVVPIVFHVGPRPLADEVPGTPVVNDAAH